MAGKGDDRRPPAVPQETFEREWDRIFGPAPVVGELRIVTTVGNHRTAQRFPPK